MTGVQTCALPISQVPRVSRNDGTLADRVHALAEAAGVEVRGVNSAFPDAAQYGTGSAEVVSLEAPRIAVVANEGISQTSYGAIWWSLEQRYGIRFTPIAADALNGDLAGFNVILVPSGGLGRLGKGENLKRWVQNGGALITFGGATRWAMGKDVDLTSARRITCPEKEVKSAAAPTAPVDTLRAAASPSACEARLADLPGNHFDVVLDLTHWLTLGMEQQRMTVLVSGGDSYGLSTEGGNVGVFPTTGPLRRAGFTFPENSEKLLRGTSFIVQERVGRGNVVMFTNDPMFRGWWRAMDRLVLNAMLLGTAF